MRRVASLYLPTLSTDRIRQERRPDGGTPGNSARPPQRAPMPETTPKEGTRLGDCSCPRGGGWRPGARWSRETEAAIEALPPHRRPTVRELGRRTEAAERPFRARNVEDVQRRATVRETAAAPTPIAPAAAPAHSALVTAVRTGNRILLAAVSDEARALGLQPGMPVTQARALVPGLDVRDTDPERDRALLAALADHAAHRWTPRAALSGSDGLFLDLTGVAHLFGGEEKMARRILRFCARFGLAARIAVADTPGAAHALARHAGAPLLLCPQGGHGHALAPLPVAALRLEEPVLAAARRLGIERIGELVAMPRAPLQRRFGKTMLARLDQALGRAAEPIDPVVPEDAPSAELRFAEPIATAEAIEAAVTTLMTRLVATLAEAGLAARLVTLACSRVDGAEQEITIGTARATRDGGHLLRLLRMRIETIEPGFGLDSLRLTAVRAEPLASEQGPSRLAGETAPDLAPLVDRLAGRLGPRRLFRLSAVESDVPERSVRRTPPLGKTTPWPDYPRPVRLLSPPERIENVLALLPDLPPRRFTWRGRAYQVARADGPERIFGEWWRRPSEAEAVRDYFQVEDESGERFWLYRRGDGVDPRTGGLDWYLHGVFG
jgi:protein ImuB